MVEQMKQCKKCEQVLPASTFAKDRNQMDKLDRHCRKCTKEYRQWLQQRPEKLKKAVVDKGDNQSGFGTLWAAYTNGAKKRGYEFSLTKDEFRELTKGNCWYCGQKPAQIKPGGYGKNKLRNGDYYLYNGVDRVNNAVGYTSANSITCCKMCNRMKAVYTAEVFLNHVRKIYNNLQFQEGLYSD